MATKEEFEIASKQLGNNFTVARYLATKPHTVSWISTEIHETIDGAIDEIRKIESASARRKAYYAIYTQGLKKKIVVLAIKLSSERLDIGYRVDEDSDFIVNEYKINGK